MERGIRTGIVRCAGDWVTIKLEIYLNDAQSTDATEGSQISSDSCFIQ